MKKLFFFKDSEGEFNWSKTQEGLVLGAFYHGYMASQLPGGYLAGRFGFFYREYNFILFYF